MVVLGPVSAEADKAIALNTALGVSDIQGMLGARSHHSGEIDPERQQTPEGGGNRDPTENSEHPPVTDGEDEGSCHERNEGEEHLYVNWKTRPGSASGPTVVRRGAPCGPVQLTVILQSLSPLDQDAAAKTTFTVSGLLSPTCLHRGSQCDEVSQEDSLNVMTSSGRGSLAPTILAFTGLCEANI